MTDAEWFKQRCAVFYIECNENTSFHFVERVGIKVDSGAKVDEARKQAFKEIYG